MIKPNLFERALSSVGMAKVAADNMRARAGILGFSNYWQGQYTGARSDKTSMRAFRPYAGSADADSLGDLTTLRARSRDLARNAPIARGARNTTKTNVVGSGLRLTSKVDRELLGLSEEAAEAWEAKVEGLFHLWASSKMSDVTRRQTFYDIQGLAFTSAWDSGDVFALRRFKEGTSFLALCVQLIEADRVSNPVDKLSDPMIRDGVEIDSDGEPIAFHVLNHHPGDTLTVQTFEPANWQRVPATSQESGTPLMIHLFEKERVGSSRGVPMLAAVIEPLKQLDRYAEAELMAAVVSAFFTVFIKTTDSQATAGLDPTNGGTHYGPPPLAGPGEMALGSGTIAELNPDEDITIANPNRPNANFDPFFLAVIRQIGIALGIPYEVLIMHFSSSYTASKAAIETARQFFSDRRTWLARNFCQPIYEWFLYEAVARGIVDAPGFLDDPIRRAAWLGSEWVGRAPIVLDAVKDANAAEKWIDLGVKTIESVTTETTGGNWKRNQEQRGRECAIRDASKITPAAPAPIKPEADPGGDSGGG